MWEGWMCGCVKKERKERRVWIFYCINEHLWLPIGKVTFSISNLESKECKQTLIGIFKTRCLHIYIHCLSSCTNCPTKCACEKKNTVAPMVSSALRWLVLSLFREFFVGQILLSCFTRQHWLLLSMAFRARQAQFHLFHCNLVGS